MVIKGTGASKGIFKGEGVHLSRNSKWSSLNALIITPDFSNITKTIFSAGCIIMKGGSITSHVPIICREKQIPCVINIKDIKKIKDGDLIEVNGSSGEIKIIKK